MTLSLKMILSLEYLGSATEVCENTPTNKQFWLQAFLVQEVEPVLKHCTHIKDVSGLDCTGPHCLHTSKVMLVTVKTWEFLIHVFVWGVCVCVYMGVGICAYMCM